MTQNRLSEAQQRWVRIGDITIDERANREIRPSHVATITRAFNPNGIGSVTLSKRKNDSQVPLDGMHRLVAMKELDMDDTYVSAMVYEDLSPSAEAAMFILLNHRLALHPVVEYKQSVKARLEPFVSIETIVKSAGCKVGTDPGHLRCVGAIRKLYDEDESGKLLSTVLHIIAGTWGPDSKSTAAAMVRGLGGVVQRYGDQIDLESLASRLGAFKPGPVLAQGRDKSHHYSTNLTHGVARAVVDIYNGGGRRRGRLAEWAT